MTPKINTMSDGDKSNEDDEDKKADTDAKAHEPALSPDTVMATE